MPVAVEGETVAVSVTAVPVVTAVLLAVREVVVLEVELEGRVLVQPGMSRVQKSSRST